MASEQNLNNACSGQSNQTWVRGIQNKGGFVGFLEMPLVRTLTPVPSPSGRGELLGNAVFTVFTPFSLFAGEFVHTERGKHPKDAGVQNSITIHLSSNSPRDRLTRVDFRNVICYI
jgi:hypothetical protein